MMATFQGNVLLTAFFFNNLTGTGRINYIHSTYEGFRCKTRYQPKSKNRVSAGIVLPRGG